MVQGHQWKQVVARSSSTLFSPIGSSVLSIYSMMIHNVRKSTFLCYAQLRVWHNKYDNKSRLNPNQNRGYKMIMMPEQYCVGHVIWSVWLGNYRKVKCGHLTKMRSHHFIKGYLSKLKWLLVQTYDWSLVCLRTLPLCHSETGIQLGFMKEGLV